MRMKQEKKNEEKKFKMADFSKWLFFKIPNSRKFYRLGLGLVGLFDAKGIDVAKPIWL